MALKGLRNLFIIDESLDEKKPEQVETKPKNETKFPSFDSAPPSTPVFPTTPTQPVSKPMSFGQLSNEHLEKVVELYQNGFDNLNQQGYDFYEFFQAIVTSGGIDNPQMYVMAMSMGSAMDKTNSKEKLLTQADFYLNEINKVHTQYVTSGTNKRQELVVQKESENHNLTSELSNLKQQYEAIANQIKAKENQLSLIDNKYQPLISDIDAKLQANDVAKDTLTTNILKVKNGINNNIK